MGTVPLRAAALAAVFGLSALPVAGDGPGAPAARRGPDAEARQVAHEAIEDRPLPGEELCGPGSRIGELEIVRLDVFDTRVPQLDHKIYRVINAVHRPMKTRLGTVRSLLTLEIGQPCDPVALEEAERVLRARNFIQDAWVEPVHRDGDKVHLRVTVQDAWSTRLGISFSNEGGESDTMLRIRETNLLGTGTELTWTEQSDQDRREQVFSWFDPAVGSSRWQLGLVRADNSDGKDEAIQLGRPFYRLDARWAVHGGARRLVREERVFVGGREVDRWSRDGRSFRAAFGIAPGGLRDGRLLRLELGVRGDEVTWSPAFPGFPVDRPDLRPLDRDQVLLGLHGSWRSIDFRRVQYVETAKRIEDFDLSQQLDFGIERTVGALSNQSGSRWSLGYRRGFQPTESTFLVIDADAGLERIGDRWANGETALVLRAFHKLDFDRTLVFGLRAEQGEALEGTRRYLLGGDTGLRGWPTRTFSGDRRVLLVAEQRYFAPWELFGWLRLGLVGFVDAGAAWDRAEGFSSATTGADVGVGLRGFLKPSSGDTTVHVDVSYAIGGALPGDERRLQLTVSTASTF